MPIARIELCDEMTVRAFNNYSKMGFNEVPMLLLEFHGTTSEVEQQIVKFKEIAQTNQADSFLWATTTQDRK